MLNTSTEQYLVNLKIECIVSIGYIPHKDKYVYDITTDTGASYEVHGKWVERHSPKVGGYLVEHGDKSLEYISSNRRPLFSIVKKESYMNKVLLGTDVGNAFAHGKWLGPSGPVVTPIIPPITFPKEISQYVEEINKGRAAPITVDEWITAMVEAGPDGNAFPQVSEELQAFIKPYVAKAFS